jgi:hypothetical protein
VTLSLFYLFPIITNLTLRSKHVSSHHFRSGILSKFPTVIVQSIVSALPLHIVKSTSPLQSIVLTSTLHNQRVNVFFCRRDTSKGDNRTAKKASIVFLFNWVAPTLLTVEFHTTSLCISFYNPYSHTSATSPLSQDLRPSQIRAAKGWVH